MPFVKKVISDIEKAKQVYVNVEGSYISTDSSDGYAKDVEILGNTLVNRFDESSWGVKDVIDSKKVLKFAGYVTPSNGSPLGDCLVLMENPREGIYTIVGKFKKTTYWNAVKARYSDGTTVLISNLNDNFELSVVTFNIKSDCTHLYIETGTPEAFGYVEEKSLILLEGDHTQNPPKCYFEGIRSVGDKVEGQELYEIPVLSRGKNLLDNDKLVEGHWISKTTGDFASDTTWKATEEFIEILPNQEYTIITEIPSGTNPGYALYDTTKRYISGGKNGYFVTPSNAKYLRLTVNTGKTAMLCLGNVSMSEPYEPYQQEDKLTILSPVQLEKVGNVADRIIEKDGVWGVEKNIETVVLDGSENWLRYYNGQRHVNCYYVVIPDIEVTFIISDKFKYGENAWDNESEDCMSGHPAGRIYVAKQNITSESDFKTWLQTNPTTVKYQTKEPQFIPLPHDQQIKLRTFANKTNISFGCEIEGTIKAQVPKSLGSSINTHTEQINNLNKELDRVKKLEESTVSTVTTESDFTTVEATSNGYFEDVKLEGKTLIASNYIEKTTTYARFKVKPNTDYTYVMTGLETTYFGVFDKLINSVIKHYELRQINAFNSGNNDEVVIHKSDDYDTDNLGGSFLIEGDHTQNPPSYFEGLMSVGDGADEIVVSSVKGDGNLFDGEIYKDSNKYWFIIRNVKNNSIYINLGQTCSYFELYECGELSDCYIKYKDWKVIKTVSNQQATITTVNKNHLIIAFDTNFFTSSEKLNKVIVNKGDAITSCKEYQSDKKRLLYYNEETQAWEKPILREWDSIEKHSDGKYYYHQRSGEVVLNGSEDWENWVTWGDDVAKFKLTYTGNMMMVNDAYTRTTALCDRFNAYAANEIGTSKGTVCNIEGFGLGYSPYKEFLICIAKTKLPTQDIAGFKKWLQANNVTVVYQLAQEEVYECTNIDLITYANETNYVVESGAIVPRTTLKVMSNISNVVRELQRKVSILENDCIQIFKYMLAGDQVSVAYMLYPEDFQDTTYTDETTNTDEIIIDETINTDTTVIDDDDNSEL